MRILLGTLIACACVACAHHEPDTSRTEPQRLNVSATRGVSGMALTSDEPGPIGTCAVMIRDDREREWLAVIDGKVQQNQTVVVPWTEFRSNSERMPDDLGLLRNDFVVTCYLDIEDGLNLTGDNEHGRMLTILHF